MVASILDLPFRERPVLELLHLATSDAVDTTYAGYGWARVDRLWLESQTSLREQPIDDALVLAIHSADDGDRLPDDIDLEFELAPDDSVLVRASAFLARWLPRLPQDASAIVLVMCNPFHATLRPLPTSVPVHYAHGDVDSWLDVDDLGARIRLSAPSWSTLET